MISILPYVAHPHIHDIVKSGLFTQTYWFWNAKIYDVVFVIFCRFFIYKIPKFKIIVVSNSCRVLLHWPLAYEDLQQSSLRSNSEHKTLFAWALLLFVTFSSSAFYRIEFFLIKTILTFLYKINIESLKKFQQKMCCEFNTHWSQLYILLKFSKTAQCQFYRKVPEMSDLCYFGKTRLHTRPSVSQSRYIRSLVSQLLIRKIRIKQNRIWRQPFQCQPMNELARAVASFQVLQEALGLCWKQKNTGSIVLYRITDWDKLIWKRIQQIYWSNFLSWEIYTWSIIVAIATTKGKYWLASMYS